ncbi:surfactin synthase thioesterase subunit [Paraburkholderia sp. GAS33]|jgi:surfactin synthase thioesterase subunit|uniref:thioesterase II family protein n=1 Tax=Paraburkholderia sp. GAS33 TaxID=3035130 RepID=UPI003D1E6A11
MSGFVAVPGALPPVRLVCLAHAGGSAMLYRRWAQRLPHGVQVMPLELPGHGSRCRLRAHTEWPALIEMLIVELAEQLDDDVPFAVFGHSMGALVGFELIHALRARHGLEPVWFGASASVAPSRRNRETHWLNCTHEAMVARLRELGGTPAALLDDRDFIDFVLPVLRADFHLCGTYAPLATAEESTVREPLVCPVGVFTGCDDRATACAEDVAAWRDETRGTCTLHRFDGGHFYLDGTPDSVMACVATSLADALARPAAPKPAAPKPVAPKPVATKGEAWTH